MRDFITVYLSHLARLRGLAYGLIFLLYQWWGQPILLIRLLNAEKQGRADPWLGVGLVALQLVDLAGFRLKWPMLRERALRWPAPFNWGQIVYYLSLLTRLFLAFLLFMNSLFAFGIDMRHTDGLLSLLMLALFFLLIAKEGLILAYLFEGWKSGPSVDLEQPHTLLREILGEVLLMIFAMVAFSLTWDYLLLTLPPVDPHEKFFGILGAILIFIFLYPPSRLPFVAEEALTQQSRFAQIASGVFFLLNLLMCVGNVPGIR